MSIRLRAADTNVVIRYLMADDAGQHPVAVAVIASGVFIPVTVMMETEWVMRSRYRLDRTTIANALNALLEIDGVRCTDVKGLTWAIARYADGADLADMIHLVMARETDGFVTFDRRIARGAGPDTPVPVEVLIVD